MNDQVDLRKTFFEGMSFAAATVNVVTTDGPAGRAGVTVSAMSSVSADAPHPTLLVCVNQASSAAEAVLRNEVFCVNVLRDWQTQISDAFAGRLKDAYLDKFDCTEWETGATGAPRVRDALVAFDCRLASTMKIGSHYVCFGAVQAVHLGQQGSALVYANRAYGAAAPLKAAGGRDRAPARGVRLGCFHSFAPFIVPRLAAALAREAPDLRLEAIETEHCALLEALESGRIDLAIMYAPEPGSSLQTTALFDLAPYLLLPESHPLAAKPSLSPADIADEPLISVSEAASSARLEGMLRASGVAPRVTYRCDSVETLRGMVGHGLGVAVMLTKPAAAITYDGMAVTARPLRVAGKPGQVVLAERAGRESAPEALALKAVALRILRAT